MALKYIFNLELEMRADLILNMLKQEFLYKVEYLAKQSSGISFKGKFFYLFFIYIITNNF